MIRITRIESAEEECGVHAREAKRSRTWSHEISHTFSQQFLAARLAGSRAPSNQRGPLDSAPTACFPSLKDQRTKTSNFEDLKLPNLFKT
jgi:hypothetical protein